MADVVNLSSGQLDRVVILQRKANPPTRNALNEPEELWNDLGVVWAQMLVTGGAEDVRADEEAAQISATFNIRWTQFNPPLSPRDRLLFNPDPTQPASAGLVYNIRRVTPIGRLVGHKIDAWARADQL